MNRIRARNLHRFIAYVAAFGLLLTTLTGVLLNHTHHLELDKKAIQSEWLLNLYGLKKPEISISVKVNDSWLVQVNQTLLCNQQILPVSGDVKQVIHIDDFVYLLTASQLHVLTSEGDWVESLDLPVSLKQSLARFVQYEQGMIGLKLEQAEWQMNEDFTALKQVKEQSSIELQALTFTQPPEALKAEILGDFPTGLSWEKVMLEMHNGYILGPIGPYALDLFAIVFALMIISGIRLTRLR